MIARQDFDRIEGATAYDNSGEKIGRVGQLYIDDETGEPTWVTVSTGLFGLSESFAPLQGAEFDGADIRLKYRQGDGQERAADRQGSTPRPGRGTAALPPLRIQRRWCRRRSR